jgi:hypothetical protein
MAVTERIRLLFEINDKAAVGSFGNIRKSINDTEGARGKMHAGLASTGQFLKANMAEAAMAAGAALVAFGVKSVKVFQDTALEAGKQADALGISTEEASRLMEVAADLGVEMGTVQGAMQRMNKAAADGAIDVHGFGNAVVFAADGTTDAYQTFINAATAIGAIEDPALRAKAAQETFGRSYGEIAELMEMDAEELREALAGVSDEQVIDDDEVRKARAFRDVMDRLGDVVTRLQLKVGELIVENADMIETFADGLEIIGEYADEAVRLADAFLVVTNPLYAVNRAINAVGEDLDLTSMSLEELQQKLRDDGFSTEQIADLSNEWRLANEAARAAAGGTDFFGESLETVDRSARDFADEVKRADDEVRDFEDALADADRALSILKGNVDKREAWRNMYESIGDLMDVIADNESSWVDVAAAADNARLATADFIEVSDKIPPEVKTELYAELNTGDLDAVRAQVELWENGIDLPIRPRMGPVIGSGAMTTTAGDVIGQLRGARAAGGPVSAGGAYLVGEQGPEILQMGNTGGNIVPNHALGGGGGGGLVVNNYGNNPNAVIAAIKQYERMNGTGWRR